MKLSEYAGAALTEVYVDGQLVQSSTAANTYGRQWVKVRAGIVAIKPSAQVGTDTVGIQLEGIVRILLLPIHAP